MTIKLFDLPLGSRFRYPGRERVYVLLDRGACGLVADAPRDDTPKQFQGMYSAADSVSECRELMVEFVPVQETA
jgi:hypothetical protein